MTNERQCLQILAWELTGLDITEEAEAEISLI